MILSLILIEFIESSRVISVEVELKFELRLRLKYRLR